MTSLAADLQTVRNDPPGSSLSFDSSGSPSASATADPAALDALHAWGQSLLDAQGTIGALYFHAATNVADADVAAALRTLAMDTPVIMGEMGKAAIDATSEADFNWAMENGPDASSELDESDAASAVIGPYVSTTCGVDVFGTQAATDAKADASLLGKEIATYFVDWSAGDPLPVVTLSGGLYRLNGEAIGTPSDGAVVTAQYANGPTDWCVEVTINGDPATKENYSAQIGLAPGTCPSGSA